MRKVIAVILAVIICLNISGCGKINNKDNNKSSSAEIPADTNIPQNSDTTNNDTSDNNTQNNIKENSENIPQTSPKDNDIAAETTKPKNAKKVKFTSNQAYADINRRIKFLGLKEYKKISGDYYTDKPQKGNKYLVLFLSVANTGNEEDYINYNYLSSKVNGKSVEHTYLVNNPKNYPPIFEHIAPNKTIGGFIVWEVPANWRSFNFTYDGWKDTDNISLSAKFTPKDLQNPIIYDSKDYQ